MISLKLCITRFAESLEISSSGRYKSLEGLRAYAILLAFCVHFFSYTTANFLGFNANVVKFKNASQFLSDPFDYFCLYAFRSHYGVDIFFILSGLLIGKMLLNKKNFAYRQYLGRRFLRIYPVYLCTYLFAVLIRTQVVEQKQFIIKPFIEGLFFINVKYNVPAWSLQYEVVFYALVPLLLFAFLRVFGKSKVAFLVLTALFVFSTFIIGRHFRFPMFFAGVFLSFYSDKELKEKTSSIPLFLLIFLYFLLNILYTAFPTYKNFMPFMMVIYSLLIVKIVFCDNFLSKLFSLRPLRLLGNISYSFYLVHGPVIWLVFRKLIPWMGFTDEITQIAVAFVASISLSVVVSLAVFYIVEKPYFTLREKNKFSKV